MPSSTEPELKSLPLRQGLKAFAIPIIAAVLSVLLGTFLVVIAFIKLEIAVAYRFTSTHRTLYTTGTAIGATIITLFITSQVRELWLRFAEVKHWPMLSGAEGGAEEDKLKLKKLQTYWRTAMRLSAPMEKLRRWNVEISFLVTALITTCIVAGVTPTYGSKTISFNAVVPANTSGTCAALRTEKELEDLNNMITPGKWQLNRDDGRQIYIPYTPTSCPQHSAAAHLGSVNILRPDSVAYVDDGTAVRPSAMGAPATIYVTLKDQKGSLRSLLQNYSDSLLETHQCVPVMEKNPVSCRREGTVVIDTNLGTFNVSTADGLCTESRPLPTVPNKFQKSYLTAKKFCHKEGVGKAVLVIGGRQFAAAGLALSLRDSAWIDGHVPPNLTPEDTYVVTCDIDTSNVWQTRTVTLTLRMSEEEERTRYTRILSGGGPCENQGGRNAEGALLQALSAQTIGRVLEVDSNSGWVEVLQNFILVSIPGDRVVDKMREPPWAFNNSNNPLEDTLGVVSAIAASHFNWDNINTETSPAKVEIITVGNDFWATVFYALPTLASGFLLVFLIQYCWCRGYYWKSRTTDLIEVFNVGNRRREDREEHVLCGHDEKNGHAGNGSSSGDKV